MSSHHQVVLEGKIVDVDRVYEACIGIDDGVITEIGSNITGERKLNIKNCLIFPGFIDPHVHSRVPGDEHKENFTTLSKAALNGGVTTVIDMPNTKPPTSNVDVLQSKTKHALDKSMIDIKFHALIIPENINQLEILAPYIIGYKIFMGKSTGGFILPFEFLKETLIQLQKTSKLTTIHCEDQEIIENNTKKFENKNYPEKHADVRSPDSEIQAVKKLLSLNPDMVNIAHVSTAEALKLIEEYRKESKSIFCEVTPHHLLLVRQDMRRLGNLGKMNPPLRTEGDRLTLINGLKSGTINFLATDHAPHTKEEKQSPNAPSGVPGLDTYGNVVSLLIEKYDMPPQQLMKVTSFNAAQAFGLTDRGRIEAGKKADLTVIDLNKPCKIEANNLYTKCRWSPFEGITFPGTVLYTIVNGNVHDPRNLSDAVI